MSDRLPAAEMRLISPARAGEVGNPTARRHDHQTGLSKSELVSSASHEMRTPLTVITGYVELLRQTGRGQLDEQQLRFIKAIEENLADLLGASEQLLELLQLEWGERQIALEPLDLTALLVTETRRWRDKLTKKKLVLTTDLESSPLWIKGDWELLTRVVRYLLGHACTYTASDGLVQLSLKKEEGYAQVTLKDTGLASTTSTNRFFFRRFFGSITAEEVDDILGTGLSLYLSQGIIEAHPGGRFWVKTDPKGGSSVGFSLPQVDRLIVA